MSEAHLALELLRQWTKKSGCSILDAGTGRQSLGWLSQLDSPWAAVTLEQSRFQVLQRDFSDSLDDQHRLYCFDWAESLEVEAAMQNRLFEVVLCDYFFGAVDRYRPHSLFCVSKAVTQRLQPKGRLLVIGRQPAGPDVEHELFDWLHRLRDGSLILCGQRPHREVSLVRLSEILSHLGLIADLEVQWLENHYELDYFHRELSAIRQNLANCHDLPKGLARSLLREVDDLRQAAQASFEQTPTIQYDLDYLTVWRTSP